MNTYIKLIKDGDVKGFLKAIDEMPASKAYVFIRDSVTSAHIKAIKESGTENYQLFQDIKIRAKNSWDYDHKLATIEEVNRACVNVYTILLRLMNIHNTDNQEEFIKLQQAINRIEEKVGLELTVWNTNETTDGGNDNVDDVQGVQEDI